MIEWRCEQGTEQWFDARIGIPSGSNAENIMTAKTMKLSAQAEGYALKLAAEIITGRSLEEGLDHVPAVMQGKLLEPEAAAAYAFEQGIGENDMRAIGFVTDDDRVYGASPDRLIGDEGLLELKCPQPNTHLKYMTCGFGMDYYFQVVMQLMACPERKWVDRVSYCPEIIGCPLYRERVTRGGDVFNKLRDALLSFHEMKLNILAMAKTHGVEPAPRQTQWVELPGDHGHTVMIPESEA